MTPFQATLRALLAHLDELYRLAQLLAPDAEAAAQLVRDVYQEALTAPPPVDQIRTWLLARLLHYAQRTEQRGASMDPARQELAKSMLERALPAAVMLLSTQDRLWLYLCDVLKLTPETAASLLQEGPEGYNQARQALYMALHRYLTPGQFALLEFGFAEEQIRAQLPQTLTRLLQPPPGALRTELLKLAGRAVNVADARVPSGGRQPATRLLVAVLIVLVASLLGWLAWRGSRPSPTSPATRSFDLIYRSAELTASLTLEQPITRPTEAERYLAQQGWRVTIPDIAYAQFIGLAYASVLPEVRVPVLLFEDHTSSHPLAIYLYNYALLDRYQDQLILSRDVLRQIEEEQHFDLHVLGRQQVLVWRYRDDIYVAITEGDATALRERIVFPS